MIVKTKLAAILATSAVGVVASMSAFAADDAGEQSTARKASLEEVVVTAQRRQQTLQDAAVAVNALTGEELIAAGITQPEDLGKISPALVAQPVGGPGVNFYMRGVGTQSGNSFGENAISFNFNGVPVARPTAPVGTFFDLERVEVVKGPQGTLYGRNATGGAINVLPKKPVLGEFGAGFNTELGNFSRRLISGSLNLPLGDNTAIRIAGQIARRDGYLSDGYQDEDGDAFRVSLLHEPNEDWSIALIVDNFVQGGVGSGSVLLDDPDLGIVAPSLNDRIGGSDPKSIEALQSYAAGVFAPPFCGGPGNWINSGCLITPGDDGFMDNKYLGFSGSIEGRFDGGILTIVPGYRSTKTNFRFYVPGFRSDIEEDARQKSLEVRFASDLDGSLQYVIGGFYFTEDQDARNAFYQGKISHNLFTPGVITTSRAVFGEATLEVDEGFRLVAGARYTNESREQSTAIITGGVPGAPGVDWWPAGGPYPELPTPFSGDLSFNEVTWKLGIEWDSAPDSLFYANVATGFKAGGFFVAAPPNNTFKPEKLTAYTIGSKNRFMDNRLQLNAEAFLWDYEDQQIGFVGGVSDQDGIYSPGGIVVNAGKATIRGFELETLFAATLNDMLKASVQYLDGEYDTLVYDAFSGPGNQPPTGCKVPSNRLANPDVTRSRFFTFDCSGMQTLNSPEWVVSLAYEHTFELSNGMNLIAGADMQMESSRFLSITFRDTDMQDSYTMANAFLKLEESEAKWSVTAFVNNIGDEDVLANTSNRPILNATYGVMKPPRTYGLRASYNF